MGLSSMSTSPSEVGTPVVASTCSGDAGRPSGRAAPTSAGSDSAPSPAGAMAGSGSSPVRCSPSSVACSCGGGDGGSEIEPLGSGPDSGGGGGGDESAALSSSTSRSASARRCPAARASSSVVASSRADDALRLLARASSSVSALSRAVDATRFLLASRFLPAVASAYRRWGPTRHRGVSSAPWISPWDRPHLRRSSAPCRWAGSGRGGRRRPRQQRPPLSPLLALSMSCALCPTPFAQQHLKLLGPPNSGLSERRRS